MVVLTLMELGRGLESEAELAQLVADYRDHPHLATALMFAGEGYLKKANALESGGDPNEARDYLNRALGVFERVITEFKGSSEVANACMWAGDTCRRLGEPVKAAGYYQRIVDDLADYDGAWRALIMIGRCWEQMHMEVIGDDVEGLVEAKAAYERLIQDYPDSPGARIAENWLNSH
jgi:tetratricopeptide (TPR) repeat protein